MGSEMLAAFRSKIINDVIHTQYIAVEKILKAFIRIILRSSRIVENKSNHIVEGEKRSYSLKGNATYKNVVMLKKNVIMTEFSKQNFSFINCLISKIKKNAQNNKMRDSLRSNKTIGEQDNKAKPAIVIDRTFSLKSRWDDKGLLFII
ncbi:hypothetical protein CCYN49044_180137 [Capnocytophaga cynodegmi]|uniref:Uncharacterized protein n=1 Tax=Capnocytophaga cynodegmi TaxID=28189 RepID=A0A0B7HD99_9FLAO|nr:hypothetical protein CCYN74_140038 [Capnocytophaga cynodegmi]CEN36609.1 hypothetical protein CCYN49044_180137 [Capnocytophaga cynodegmi]